jgi:hypothetical protein
VLIDEQGLTVMDRYGVPKANPANDILRINKTQAMSALKILGLENNDAIDDMLKDFM